MYGYIALKYNIYPKPQSCCRNHHRWCRFTCALKYICLYTYILTQVCQFRRTRKVIVLGYNKKDIICCGLFERLVAKI